MSIITKGIRMNELIHRPRFLKALECALRVKR
jgi:hypothetical protein